MRWLDRLLSKRRHDKQIRACKKEGHFLVYKGGVVTPHTIVDGAPVPSGPAAYWIYQCLCGYNEANDMNLKPYRRSWAEAEAFKKSKPQMKVN